MAVNDERVRDFLPSLYVNLGCACELVGDLVVSERFYKLAADKGLIHAEDGINRSSL